MERSEFLETASDLQGTNVTLREALWLTVELDPDDGTPSPD